MIVFSVVRTYDKLRRKRHHIEYSSGWTWMKRCERVCPVVCELRWQTNTCSLQAFARYWAIGLLCVCALLFFYYRLWDSLLTDRLIHAMHMIDSPHTQTYSNPTKFSEWRKFLLGISFSHLYKIELFCLRLRYHWNVDVYGFLRLRPDFIWDEMQPD